MTGTLVALTTFAAEADAARVVRALVEERLVACGNVLPGARSIYRWRGAVADEREVVVILKTHRRRWAALLARLRELHPYETPELLALPVEDGDARYLAWLDEALAGEDA